LSKHKRDFAVIVIGRILQVVFAFLSVRLTTTLLGPTQLGRMNLVLGVTSWFSLLLISPVSNYLNRQTLDLNNQGKLLPSLVSYTVFLAGVALIASFVLAAIHVKVGVGTPIQLSWLLGLVVATIFVGMLSTTLVTVVNMLGQRIWFVLLSNLSLWLGLGAAVGMSSWFGQQTEYWMSGLLIGQMIVMLLSIIVIYRLAARTNQEPERTERAAGFDIRSIFLFSWPLIISTAFYWLQNSGYRFVLVGLTDETTVGLFVAGIAIAISPMVMFETLVGEYYRPIFYREITHSSNIQKGQTWNLYASAYFPAVILVAIFMAFSGPLLARILVSQAFQDVSWLAFWGAIVQAALMINATYVLLVFASLDTRIMIWPNVIGAIVALSGLLILVPWHPLLGTGVALSLGMLVTMIDLARRLHPIFSLQLPWRRITWAGLISLPLVIGLKGIQWLWPEPTLFQTIGGLGIAGIYMMGSQFILARKWLGQRDKSVVTSQGITRMKLY